MLVSGLVKFNAKLSLFDKFLETGTWLCQIEHRQLKMITGFKIRLHGRRDFETHSICNPKYSHTHLKQNVNLKLEGKVLCLKEYF